MEYESIKEHYSGLVLKIIFNEGSTCNFEEKILIGLVVWNRLKDRLYQNKYNFNAIEKDFLGYSQIMTIKGNNFDVNVLNNCIKATNRSFNLFRFNEHENLYFFNLSGKLELKYYKLAKYKQKLFKHTFYYITEKKEV